MACAQFSWHVNKQGSVGMIEEVGGGRGETGERRGERREFWKEGEGRTPRLGREG